jgi:hypothetical protein
MDMVKADQILTCAAHLGMEYEDIKWLLGQHENCIMEMKQKVKAAGSQFDYSPFAETGQHKQSKPLVATADSKEWTKRVVSSVYSLHSDAHEQYISCTFHFVTLDAPATVHASCDRCMISF